MIGANPREIKKLLKRMGLGNIDIDELSNVSAVDIRLLDGTTITVRNPQVSVIKMPNKMLIYQVQASEASVEKRREAAEVPEGEVNEDDISLVVEQTGASREEAVEALKASGGDIVQAVMSLLKKKGAQQR